MGKKRAIYAVLMVILLGVFGYSAYKLGSYYLEKHRSDQFAEQVSRHIRPVTRPQRPEPEQEPGGQKAPEGIAVDFEELWQINQDIVAVLYGPDTPIQYAVAQAEDNDYYLHRLLDGSWNNNGTLFLDYRCPSDFSDANSIIYGHHMKSGVMFGTLVKYREQAYYDEHPVMYLATPDGQYRVELFAGCTVEASDDIYSLNFSEEYVAQMMGKSTFVPREGIAAEGPVLTLSTCAYDFRDARYVVLGRLVRID